MTNPDCFDKCQEAVARGMWRGAESLEIAQRGRAMVEDSKSLLMELARAHSVLQATE